MDERIQRTLKRWYVKENALFQVLCTHDIVENTQMNCTMRSGRARVEVNPSRLSQLSEVQLESTLRAEAIRILLKHPYERRPFGCEAKSMTMGSNLVLADNYDFSQIGLRAPAHYGLTAGQAYEWYTQHVNDKANDDKSDRFSTDTTDEQRELEEAYTAEGEGEGNAETGNNPGGSQSQLGRDGQRGEPDERKSSADAQPEQQLSQPSAQQESQEHEQGEQQQGEGKQADAQSDEAPDSEDNYDDEMSEDEYDEEGEENPELEPEIGAEPNSGRGEEELNDSSALWEEDVAMQQTIESAIEKISAAQSWGSLPADLVALIVANTAARLDYRKVLAGFRASALSSRRSLTRMRPNRRSGFEAMGSVRRLCTKLLVAIDVSGSVSDEDVSHFFSVVNRAFRYGVEQLDLLTFDSALSEVKSFARARRNVVIHGRGGTNFQQVFDFVREQRDYDGLLIFTDGFAPPPKKPAGMQTKVCWVCATERQLEKHQEWMRKTGRCCAIVQS